MQTMSTSLKQKHNDAMPPASDRMNRLPQQGRSRASLERMLAAARNLMLERGSEEFTLQEVSQRGNVSIGSIYLRFESKDNLVRAVIGASDSEIGGAESAMFEMLRAECASLEVFVPRYVEAYAEVLKRFAPLLRLSMERASFDPQVSGPGKERANTAAAAATAAILSFKDEIAGPDCETKADAAFRIIFATLARQLSLGSTPESMDSIDWEQLKRELGRMTLAYLKADI
jgi:AcrR family transcriptional regulator